MRRIAFPAVLLLLAAGCSVTGRVSVGAPQDGPAGRKYQRADVRDLPGTLRADLEFNHTF